MASAASPSSVKIPPILPMSTASRREVLLGYRRGVPHGPKAISYTIDYYDAYTMRGSHGTASYPVSDDLGHGMNYLGITGGGGPAPCDAGMPQREALHQAH